MSAQSLQLFIYRTPMGGLSEFRLSLVLANSHTEVQEILTRHKLQISLPLKISGHPIHSGLAVIVDVFQEPHDFGSENEASSEQGVYVFEPEDPMSTPYDWKDLLLIACVATSETQARENLITSLRQAALVREAPQLDIPFNLSGQHPLECGMLGEPHDYM